jgi:hypothetical protein
MSAEKKPTAETLKVAREMVGEWQKIEPFRFRSLVGAIATLITAKDATITRYQKAVDTQLGEIRALEKAVREKDAELVALKTSVVTTIGGQVEGHPTAEHNYLQRLRELVSIEDQNQQQRALLVSLATALCNLHVDATHPTNHITNWMMRNDGETVTSVREARKLLSTPALVELLKEGKTL